MTNQYPRLRSHIRRRKNGKVVTYYIYDMRGTGEKDIPLGTNYDDALKKWDEAHNRKPRIVGTMEQAFEAWEAEMLPTYTNKGTRDLYTRNLRKLRPAFGAATWDGVRLPDLKAYLKLRTAKTQGNREMSLLSIIWNWARTEGYTDLPWPAAGMERSGWKNKEKARLFEVTDELFSAVYDAGDQTLRDAMDIATATAMRVTDVRTIRVPHNGILRLVASKTGKPIDYDISESPVLSSIWERRKEYRANHLMFLSTPTGQVVSYEMLRSRWDKARDAAAKQHPEIAEQIHAMFLRDMRSRASDLTETLDDAAELLQHSSKSVTKKHYRMRAVKGKTVR